MKTMTSAHGVESLICTTVYKSRFLVVVAMLSAACYPVLATSLLDRDSSGKTLSESDGTPMATHIDRRQLSEASGCSNSTWLCSATPDLQHRVSDALHTAINGGQCVRVSATLRLWRCYNSLVPDEVKQMVLNNSCTAECSPPTQHCAAPTSVPVPAPSASHIPSCTIGHSVFRAFCFCQNN